MSTRGEAPLNYVYCDLPPGVTIPDYRRSRTASAAAQQSTRCRWRRRIRALRRRLARSSGRSQASRGLKA